VDEFLMSLQALTVVKISGVSSFSATPGHFYRVDTSSGNVNANLPAVSGTDGTSWLIVKKISSDANVVNVNANGSENMNGSSGPNVLSGNNQSHQFIPNTPSFYGTGWFSW
jgi:hypothetical protein